MVVAYFLSVDLAEYSFGSCKKETGQGSQTIPPFPKNEYTL